MALDQPRRHGKNLVTPLAPGSTERSAALPERDSGPQGNERLTAITGAVLLVLFTVESLTALSLGNLLTLHFFLGMLLLGPVTLKIGSTLWRFFRYYTGSAPYVRRGAPSTLHRVLGPVLILSTLAVLGSGVMLAIVGRQDGVGPWDVVHRFSFLLWLVVILIHAVAYTPRLPRLLSGRPAAGGARVLLAASRTRWLLLGGSLVSGLIVALLTYHLAAKWGFSGGGIIP